MNPLLEEQILATIAEIQEKSKSICKKLGGRGEVARNACQQLNREAELLFDKDPIVFKHALSGLINNITLICQHLPDDFRIQSEKILDEVNHTKDDAEKLEKVN